MLITFVISTYRDYGFTTLTRKLHFGPDFFAFYMITNLLFCISSQDVTCLHVLQAPRINALCGRGTHSAATTSRLCRLMRTCIAATRKVSHVFIYKYVYKVSGAHAPLGPTVDTPLCFYINCADRLTVLLEYIDLLCSVSKHSENLGEATFHCCILAFGVIIYAKQKQPGCKKSARPIRSHKYKRPKTLISSKAKKLNILLRIFLLE